MFVSRLTDDIGLPQYLAIWVMNCHFQIRPLPLSSHTQLKVGNFQFWDFCFSAGKLTRVDVVPR